MWPVADITLSSRTVVRPYYSRAGSPRVLTLPCASTHASTAFIAVGNVVQFDLTSTSHHKIIRNSSAATLTGLLSTTIAGVAAEAEPTTGTDPKISVWAADHNTEFIFPTKIAGTASSLVGTLLPLAWDSTLNIHYLFPSTGGAESVWVTEVPNPGDTNGYVVGKFQSTRVHPSVWTR